MTRLFGLFALLSLPLSAAPEYDCGPPKNVVGGDYLGEVADYARDVHCAKRLLERSAPKGFVTIFGSARLAPAHPQYGRFYRFALAWTRRRPEVPIMTGGGPGLMEAANKGAKDAGGKSLGFSTRFDKHGVEKPNRYTTDALEFSDFALRESWLINPARAIVVGSGGMGTGWELFEALSKKQTGKIARIPIVFLGPPEEWAAVRDLLRAMVRARTIGPHDETLVHFSPDVEDALRYLEKNVPR